MSVLTHIQSKGVILRSREPEIEEGEKCRYLFKKIITWGGALTTLKSDGRVVNETEEILRGVGNFYSDLYGLKVVHEVTLMED